MDDIEAYNNYDEIPPFTDFPKKISVVEKNLPKDILPWESRYSGLASCLMWSVYVNVCL